MQRFRTWLLEAPLTAPRATILIRLMAGGVFFWEGLLKFVYANQGVGRFTKLGMPMPAFTAPSIAVLEIGGGLLLMSGLGTRFVTMPFIIEMIVAMLSTKITLYLGTSPLPLPPSPPSGRHLGGAARDSLGVRPADVLRLPAVRRARTMVARRVAAQGDTPSVRRRAHSRAGGRTLGRSRRRTLTSKRRARG